MSLFLTISCVMKFSGRRVMLEGVCVCVLMVSGARHSPMLMLADSALKTEERARTNMYVNFYVHTHMRLSTLSHYVIAGDEIIGEKEEREKLEVYTHSYTLYWHFTALTDTHTHSNTHVSQLETLIILLFSLGSPNEFASCPERLMMKNE